MKVLVIGGHGFLGRHIVAQLASSGHEAVSLSRRDGFDLTDLQSARRGLERVGPEAVINCAAHVGSVHYVDAKAASVFHDNVQMALNLYRVLQEVCPAARIVNPLSNCSYPGDADVQREEDWWAGAVHPSVMSYGNSRRFIYVLSACYKRQHGTRTVNFLVPNSFGPGDYTDPNKTHALNGMVIRMIQAQRRGDPEFEVWGTGRPVREWGFIKDMARAVCLGVDTPHDLTYPVNVAQNAGASIAESARAIATAIGYAGRLTFNAAYQDGAPRKVLDDRRFRELFPGFTFTEHELGIRETVAYYEAALPA
jgi:GDP-L-fucose synthase